MQWYRENKSLRRETNNLKRQSALLMQRVADASPDLDITALAGMGDAVDKKELQDLQQQHEKEVDSLMEKIKGNLTSFRHYKHRGVTGHRVHYCKAKLATPNLIVCFMVPCSS